MNAVARKLRPLGAAKLVAATVLSVLAAMSSTASSAAKFVLTSKTLVPGKRMPDAQVHNDCGGDNVSPQLSWSGAPAGTKSYALMLHDPDAPTGSGWWHWVLFNIPAEVTELAEGAGDPKTGLIPEAIQGRNDFGSPGYGGACPPEGHGDHRYQFKLFALKTEQLPLDEKDAPAEVRSYVDANKLAEAQLEVVYGR